MVQNDLLDDSFENRKGFFSKLILVSILETVLCRNFAKNRLFWLAAPEQDMGTTQILYHSQKKLSVVISRISRGAMDSSLFREWCLISGKNQNFAITNYQLGSYGLSLFTK